MKVRNFLVVVVGFALMVSHGDRAIFVFFHYKFVLFSCSQSIVFYSSVSEESQYYRYSNLGIRTCHALI